MLDREAQQPLTRLARDREAEAGVLVELVLDVRARRPLEPNDVERRDHPGTSVPDPLTPVGVEPRHQPMPGMVVVKCTGRATAVGERVHGHHGRDAPVMACFGDHQRPSPQPRRMTGEAAVSSRCCR
jgi:hypothetical protein